MSSRGAPKNQDLRKSNLAKKYSQSNQGITTVMIRNIPKEYSQDELIEEVSSIMGHEPFDFFYLPWDFQHNANVGYAFVNFHRSKSAHLAMKLFAKYQFKVHPSPKLGDASPAHIQGLENNLRHLEHRAVVHENHPCSPVVMWKGQKIELSVIFQVMRNLDNANRVKQPRSMLVAGSAANRDQGQARQQFDDNSLNDGFAQLLDLAVGLSSPGMESGGAASHLAGASGMGRDRMGIGGMSMQQDLGGPSGEMQVDDLFEQSAMDYGEEQQQQQQQHQQQQHQQQQHFGALHAPMPPPDPPGFRQPMSWPMSQRSYDQGHTQQQHLMGYPRDPYARPEPLIESVSGEGSYPSAHGPDSQPGASREQPAYVSMPPGLRQRQQQPGSAGGQRQQQPGSTGSAGAKLGGAPGLYADPGAAPGLQRPGPSAAGGPQQLPVAPTETGPVVREIRVPRSQEDALQKYLKKFGDM